MHAKARVITVHRPLNASPARTERCYPMAASQIDWAFWFVMSSPILGVLLGWVGVFILAR